MAAMPKAKLTEEEYLAVERHAEFKSEFWNGEMFAMAGASRAHNELKENLSGELFARLKGGRCRTYSSDMRLKVTRTGLYTYPDLMIVCGPPEFDPKDHDVLLNPQVVIEILSKATESYDRGSKFRHYQRLPSMQEYVLITPYEVQLERYVRQPDDKWLLTTFDDLASDFTLETVPVRITLADLYRNVDLEAPPLR